MAIVVDCAQSAAYSLGDPFHAAVVPQGSSEAFVGALIGATGAPTMQPRPATCYAPPSR